MNKNASSDQYCSCCGQSMGRGKSSGSRGEYKDENDMNLRRGSYYGRGPRGGSRERQDYDEDANRY
jgi:hypothetical protein